MSDGQQHQNPKKILEEREWFHFSKSKHMWEWFAHHCHNHPNILGISSFIFLPLSSPSLCIALKWSSDGSSSTTCATSRWWNNHFWLRFLWVAEMGKDVGSSTSASSNSYSHLELFFRPTSRAQFRAKRCLKNNLSIWVSVIGPICLEKLLTPHWKPFNLLDFFWKLWKSRPYKCMRRQMCDINDSIELNSKHRECYKSNLQHFNRQFE